MLPKPQAKIIQEPRVSFAANLVHCVPMCGLGRPGHIEDQHGKAAEQQQTISDATCSSKGSEAAHQHANEGEQTPRH